MNTAVAIVQGASRGIGLQFCKTLLKQNQELLVVATCRNPDNAYELKVLESQNPSRLQIHQVDVQNESHIQTLSDFVKEKYGKVDLLINSAGMLHPSGRGETSLRDVSSEV